MIYGSGQIFLVPDGNTVPTREKIYKNALVKPLIGY